MEDSRVALLWRQYSPSCLATRLAALLPAPEERPFRFLSFVSKSSSAGAGAVGPNPTRESVVSSHHHGIIKAGSRGFGQYDVHSVYGPRHIDHSPQPYRPLHANNTISRRYSQRRLHCPAQPDEHARRVVTATSMDWVAAPAPHSRISMTCSPAVARVAASDRGGATSGNVQLHTQRIAHAPPVAVRKLRVVTQAPQTSIPAPGIRLSRHNAVPKQSQSERNGWCPHLTAGTPVRCALLAPTSG